MLAHTRSCTLLILQIYSVPTPCPLTIISCGTLNRSGLLLRNTLLRCVQQLTAGWSASSVFLLGEINTLSHIKIAANRKWVFCLLQDFGEPLECGALTKPQFICGYLYVVLYMYI